LVSWTLEQNRPTFGVRKEIGHLYLNLVGVGTEATSLVASKTHAHSFHLTFTISDVLW